MKKTSNESQALIGMGFNNYQDLYLEWVNNFLTTQGFANYYNIELGMAELLIANAIYLYKD